MIRWYDYVTAVIAADLLMTGALYALTADVWYMSLIGGFVAVAVWDGWDVYCQLRKNHESKR